MADDFAAGFLGSLLKNQEAGMAANKPNPELQLKLMQMQSEGTIQKKPGAAPFANDPQGAMNYIAQMMGMGGKSNPVEGYQAAPAQDFRPTLEGAYPTAALPEGTINRESAATLDKMLQENALAGGKRKDYFSVQNYIPGEGYLTHNAADNTFKIVAEKRGVGKNAPNMSGENAEFFAKAKTLSSVMSDIDGLYQDSYVGPIAGRVGRAVDIYTPFGDKDRSRFRNQVSKAFNTLVYLRSGKQINQEEANRLAEEFMAVNNTPVAFKSGWNSMKDELNTLVNSRQETLQKSGYAFADQFQGYGQINPNRGASPETATGMPQSAPTVGGTFDGKRVKGVKRIK
jgi:hypothetical protein